MIRLKSNPAWRARLMHVRYSGGVGTVCYFRQGWYGWLPLSAVTIHLENES